MNRFETRHIEPEQKSRIERAINARALRGRTSELRRAEAEINALTLDKEILGYYMPHKSEETQQRALLTLKLIDRAISDNQQTVLIYEKAYKWVG